MRYSLLAHRLLFPGLAAVSVALVYALASPGGGNAQTPVPSATASPTASPTFFIPAATLTAAAGNPQVAAQQQVPATSTPTTVVNAAATIAALQQQGAIATATYAASLAQTQPNLAATATYVASIAQAQTALTPSPTPATAVATAATATPAAPSAATAVDACAMPLAAASGGQTIEFQQVALTLPSSGNYMYGLIDGSGNAAPQIVVCSVPTTSTIYINAMTGAETARRASGDSGANALNAIRAGARAQGSTPVAIAPPNTGDAGLR